MFFISVAFFSLLSLITLKSSYTEDEERKVCLTTPSIRAAKEGQYSRMLFIN